MAEVAAQVQTLYATTRIDTSSDGVRVRMVPPKPVVLIGFLGVWFVGWTFGGIAAFASLARGGLSLVTLFLLVWLVGWLAGETIVGVLLAYLVAGEHVLHFTPTELVRKQHVAGIGLTWHYPAEHVSKLRAAETGEPGHERTALQFDYAGTPVSVNVDVTPEDASGIARAVLDALPQYA